MAVEIKKVDANFEREPLAQPFGFKGGTVKELWQPVVLLKSSSDHGGIGLGTQSVLWADANLFAAHTESGGNALMFALTEKALQLSKGRSFETPIELQETLLDEVSAYGRALAGRELEKTFVLNALVPLDHAAWLLYARENDIQSLDAMIPGPYRPALGYRHDKVASIPVFGYEASLDKVEKAAMQGHYVMKIKLGQPGTQKEMLGKDKKWLTAIHEVVGRINTPYTDSGNIQYYLDANGRYARVETLQRLLDHADSIGALDRIVIVEEPFPQSSNHEVGQLPVRIAADESAHTDRDALRVIEKGYEAIALKPIAKTLSMTLKIAKVAHEHDVPCFCADLTVNPVLVDWNKNVAARLKPFPGFTTGLLETNGHQNYARWSQMKSYHPVQGASWTMVQNGIFRTGQDFYEESAGIFAISDHYSKLVGQ